MSVLVPNEQLMEQRNLTEASKSKLKDVYSMMNVLLTRPSVYENPVEMVEALEYTMQFLWDFPLNKNYHSYWFHIKGCECPKLDNQENLGVPYRIINHDCPWHGEG